MNYEPVIGLEIHAQLATQTKMFSRAKNSFNTNPNQNTVAYCYGLPGVLPTINKKAVEFAVRLGHALNCSIRLDSQFARKHYFYPDLPKAYQISQYDRPICENGSVEIEVNGKTRTIGITRIHMEEDAGKLSHEGADPSASYVDLNRAGSPLLEIVSEPEIFSAEEAKAYMEKIHSVVTHLGVCNGDMEKGNFRCDANISVRPKGTEAFGTRTETKNLNSFRFVQKAIEYEIARQVDAILDGGEIVQETRLFDSKRGVTVSMRTKEDAQDYRYFPCPDLPVVKITREFSEKIKESLPELPDQKRDRYMSQFNLNRYDASVISTQKEISKFFDECLELDAEPKQAANYIMSDLMRLLNEHGQKVGECKITPKDFTDLLKLIEGGIISGKIAKSVFEVMFAEGKKPETIIEEKGLKQISDTGELEKICTKIVESNPGQAEQYRSGKDRLFGFFVGAVMKETGGKANPKIVNEILKKLLS